MNGKISSKLVAAFLVVGAIAVVGSVFTTPNSTNETIAHANSELFSKEKGTVYFGGGHHPITCNTVIGCSVEIQTKEGITGENSEAVSSALAACEAAVSAAAQSCQTDLDADAMACLNEGCSASEGTPAETTCTISSCETVFSNFPEQGYTIQYFTYQPPSTYTFQGQDTLLSLGSHHLGGMTCKAGAPPVTGSGTCMPIIGGN